MKLWNEKGWLIVRRNTPDGNLDWQIVLARATDPRKPEIKVDESWGTIEIRYREYFIREAPFGRLRVLRERKTNESPAWPLVEFENRPRSLATMGRANFSIWELDYWCWVESGPTKERPDVWIRLRPATKRTIDFSRTRGDFRPSMALGGPFEISYGDSELQDEGDLLIAFRATMDLAERGLTDASLAEWLKTESAPAITAPEWLNAAKPPTPDELKDQVVLLSFWSASCPMSVKTLVRLESLHKKYGPQGLVVISVYAAEKSDHVAEALKENGATFPTAIETGALDFSNRVPGETARRYHVDVLPACFLIDKQGKVVRGYGTAPPTDAQIEALLK
ncbi:MAG TPA: TlpA disulfide reductase family protein [Planctomycetaceae bacterium]|nr:TlpA disulfide reductase family protein [Planctomycetaceae bacterium]